MSTNLKAQKKGNDWEGRIYFINDTTRPDEVYYYSEMQKLVNMNENIIRKRKYKTPLSRWQLTSWIFHHKFVVIETNYWYWSIEKNGSGIWIQRSKKLFDVKCKIGNDLRPGEPTLLEEKFGRFVTLQFIMDYLIKNELSVVYYYTRTSMNCKGFAERLFNFITES